MPHLGRNVRLGSGCCLLGPIRIGHGVRIGPNCVVISNVPTVRRWSPAPRVFKAAAHTPVGQAESKPGERRRLSRACASPPRPPEPRLVVPSLRMSPPRRNSWTTCRWSGGVRSSWRRRSRRNCRPPRTCLALAKLSVAGDEPADAMRWAFAACDASERLVDWLAAAAVVRRSLPRTAPLPRAARVAAAGELHHHPVGRAAAVGGGPQRGRGRGLRGGVRPVPARGARPGQRPVRLRAGRRGVRGARRGARPVGAEPGPGRGRRAGTVAVDVAVGRGPGSAAARGWSSTTSRCRRRSRSGTCPRGSPVPGRPWRGG